MRGVTKLAGLDADAGSSMQLDFQNEWLVATRDDDVVATVMSADHVYGYELPALNGASAALMLSDIPYYHPIAAVRVGLVDIVVSSTGARVLYATPGAPGFFERQELLKH